MITGPGFHNGHANPGSPAIQATVSLGMFQNLANLHPFLFQNDLFFPMAPEEYTLADLNVFLGTGRIDPLLWLAYFPDTLDLKIPSCEDCLAFREESCPGLTNPVDCFLLKSSRVRPFIGK